MNCGFYKFNQICTFCVSECFIKVQGERMISPSAVRPCTYPLLTQVHWGDGFMLLTSIGIFRLTPADSLFVSRANEFSGKSNFLLGATNIDL